MKILPPQADPKPDQVCFCLLDGKFSICDRKNPCKSWVWRIVSVRSFDMAPHGGIQVCDLRPHDATPAGILEPRSADLGPDIEGMETCRPR